MSAASVAVIARKYPEYSVGALLGVVVVQGFGYGLIFDLNFFLRNLSVIGGLLMVLSDSLSKKKTLFAGLPSISETDRRIYFQVRKISGEKKEVMYLLHIDSLSVRHHPIFSWQGGFCSSSSLSDSLFRVLGPLRG